MAHCRSRGHSQSCSSLRRPSGRCHRCRRVRRARAGRSRAGADADAPAGLLPREIHGGRSSLRLPPWEPRPPPARGGRGSRDRGRRIRGRRAPPARHERDRRARDRRGRGGGGEGRGARADGARARRGTATMEGRVASADVSVDSSSRARHGCVKSHFETLVVW